MLTLIETISLAGDRAKQNDDALGFTGSSAWVIDGATDLHAEPISGRASDAAWLAGVLNECLMDDLGRLSEVGASKTDLHDTIEAASNTAAGSWRRFPRAKDAPRWALPTASALIIGEDADVISGLDLGDCRVFALDADGALHVAGGLEGGRDAEAAAAAKQTDTDKPLLQRSATIDLLRRARASLNQPGAQWSFCIDQECADHARIWSLTLKRPAHLLLMTDGFWVLADQYRAYDPAGLVRAALDKGLQELGREIRAIENEDSSGAKHPRFKRSDDATAVLLRLT